MFRILIVVLFAPFVSLHAAAGGVVVEQLYIDFARPTSAPLQAQWSGVTPSYLKGQPNFADETPGESGECLELTGKGLSPPPKSPCDAYWIRTLPKALGSSWRPTRTVSSTLTLHFTSDEDTKVGESADAKGNARAFIRYSPDLVHWSSWQAMTRKPGDENDSSENTVQEFVAQTVTPDVEWQPYGDLLREYALGDVPWASDEGAAVQWIVNNDPEFFSKQIPFIGYVEYLYESRLKRSDCVDSLSIDIAWSVGGLTTAPKPGTPVPREGSWAYDARTL